jgi:hypothetical protein
MALIANNIKVTGDGKKDDLPKEISQLKKNEQALMRLVHRTIPQVGKGTVKIIIDGKERTISRASAYIIDMLAID